MKYLLIPALLLAAACTDTTPVAVPACEGTEVIVLGEGLPGCDLTPPQVLSYRLDNLEIDDLTLETADLDCLNAGGTPDWSNGPRTMTCRNVDW